MQSSKPVFFKKLRRACLATSATPVDKFWKFELFNRELLQDRI